MEWLRGKFMLRKVRAKNSFINLSKQFITSSLCNMFFLGYLAPSPIYLYYSYLNLANVLLCSINKVINMLPLKSLYNSFFTVYFYSFRYFPSDYYFLFLFYGLTYCFRFSLSWYNQHTKKAISSEISLINPFLLLWITAQRKWNPIIFFPRLNPFIDFTLSSKASQLVWPE